MGMNLMMNKAPGKELTIVCPQCRTRWAENVCPESSRECEYVNDARGGEVCIWCNNSRPDSNNKQVAL